MFLKKILSPNAALLLPQVMLALAAESGSMNMNALAPAFPDPHSYMAMPVKLLAKPKGGASSKRSLIRKAVICDVGYHACDPYDKSQGCCEDGYYCGVFQGIDGCCPDGKKCDGPGGCDKGQVDCVTFCCESGQTCATDSLGLPACKKSSDACGGVSGYSECTNMDGCCPTGAACIPPNKCDVKCTSADVPCGTGCCSPGLVCDSTGDHCTKGFSTVPPKSSSTKPAPPPPVISVSVVVSTHEVSVTHEVTHDVSVIESVTKVVTEKVTSSTAIVTDVIPTIVSSSTTSHISSTSRRLPTVTSTVKLFSNKAPMPTAGPFGLVAGIVGGMLVL